MLPLPVYLDVTKFKLISKNNKWKLYLIGNISNDIQKGVLVENNSLGEQLQCRFRIIERNGRVAYIILDYMDPISYTAFDFNTIFISNKQRGR